MENSMSDGLKYIHTTWAMASQKPPISVAILENLVSSGLPRSGLRSLLCDDPQSGPNTCAFDKYGLFPVGLRCEEAKSHLLLAQAMFIDDLPVERVLHHAAVAVSLFYRCDQFALSHPFFYAAVLFLCQNLYRCCDDIQCHRTAIGNATLNNLINDLFSAEGASSFISPIFDVANFLKKRSALEMKLTYPHYFVLFSGILLNSSPMAPLQQQFVSACVNLSLHDNDVNVAESTGVLTQMLDNQKNTYFVSFLRWHMAALNNIRAGLMTSDAVPFVNISQIEKGLQAVASFFYKVKNDEIELSDGQQTMELFDVCLKEPSLVAHVSSRDALFTKSKIAVLISVVYEDLQLGRLQHAHSRIKALIQYVTLFCRRRDGCLAPSDRMLLCSTHLLIAIFLDCLCCRRFGSLPSTCPGVIPAAHIGAIIVDHFSAAMGLALTSQRAANLSERQHERCIRLLRAGAMHNMLTHFHAESQDKSRPFLVPVAILLPGGSGGTLSVERRNEEGNLVDLCDVLAEELTWLRSTPGVKHPREEDGVCILSAHRKYDSGDFSRSLDLLHDLKGINAYSDCFRYVVERAAGDPTRKLNVFANDTMNHSTFLGLFWVSQISHSGDATISDEILERFSKQRSKLFAKFNDVMEIASFLRNVNSEYHRAFVQ